jgi:hypothetical protein
MSAADTTSEKAQNQKEQLEKMLIREKQILRLKGDGRNCLKIQKELGIELSDGKGIKHLREIFFGQKLGALPHWTVDKDHSPVKSSPENAMHMIKEMGFEVRYNLLKCQPFLSGKPMQDLDLSLIQNEAKRLGLNASAEHLIAVIDEMAKNDSYHPFKEWVESKAWDGQDHLSKLFDTLTVQPDFNQFMELYKIDVHRWFIGMIAKQYEPGSQNFVLVFQGFQGIGKDKWFQRLVPIEGCYSEGEIDPANKDHKFIHRENVLRNVAEIDSTIRKKDASALKQYLTLKDLSERAAYGQFKESFKSGCSFCGSVNDPQFLNDSSGSRRFRVIPIQKLNHAHAVDIQQVFAQALELFKARERYWFDEAELDERNEANATFAIEDAIDLLASRVEAGDVPMTCTDILRAMGTERPNKSDTVKLGGMLTKKGIPSRVMKINGVSLKHYLVSDPQAALFGKASAK